MSSYPTLTLHSVKGNATAFRRVSHGNIRFSTDTRQPQDGATHSAAIAALSPRNFPLVAAEPEDARLTGMTRSLNRRLMGLNVCSIESISKARPARITAAATITRQVA